MRHTNPLPRVKLEVVERSEGSYIGFYNKLGKFVRLSKCYSTPDYAAAELSDGSWRDRVSKKEKLNELNIRSK